MKRTHEIIIGLMFMILTSNAQIPTLTWAKFMGSTGFDVGLSITHDASGNIYTTGFFQGTTDFDPGSGTYTLTAIGGYDIFIQKLDAAGNFVWAKSMGGSAVDEGNCIGIDNLGNVYTTGFFQGTCDFDPGPGTLSLTSIGGVDIYVQKLDASGNFIWAKNIGGVFNDIGCELAFDNTNVYITGPFENTVDFNPGPGTYTLASLGAGDIFVMKLDGSGNFIWAKKMGNTSFDYAFSIASDASGNVYSTGYYSGTVDFDPGPATYNLTSVGGFDIYVQKLDALGNFKWAKSMGGSLGDLARSIAVDASNVYITGYFNGTADFDPGAASYSLTSAGAADIFVQKMDTSGNFIWAKSNGGLLDEYGLSITVDASSLYVNGHFESTSDFDPSSGVYNLTSNGGQDIFIEKLDTAGNFNWAMNVGGVAKDNGYSIIFNAAAIYITGLFEATVDFDPGPGTYSQTCMGSQDVFVAKYYDCSIPTQPTSINGNTIVCNGATNIYSVSVVSGATSYSWNLPASWSGSGTTNTILATSGVSGVFTVTANNLCGASSQQTLNVTVNPLPTVSANTNNSLICGQPFQGTATLTASGASTYTWNTSATTTAIAVSPSVTTSYTVTGTDANGCMNSSVFTQSVSTCTGVNQLASIVSEINIYPNPFTHKITIILSSNMLQAGQPVLVFDMLGSLVYKTSIESERTEIDLANQSAGIYFIRIGILSKKIIKN